MLGGTERCLGRMRSQQGAAQLIGEERELSKSASYREESEMGERKQGER